MKIPSVTFRTRIGDDESLGGGCAIGRMERRYH